MHNRNKIQVYHGSDHIIKTPIYLGGKDDNDYGNGFYTTEYEDRAKSWAALNGKPSRSIVNKYELDLDGLNVLNLADFGVLAWIAEVVSNRGTSQEATEILRRWTSGKSSLLRGTDGILKEVPRKSNLPVFFEKEKPLPL